MQDEKTSTIRRDSALSGYRAHRDGGRDRVRHRVKNRDACGLRIRNEGLEPMRCHGNTNRETAYGDVGDDLVGRGVDHSNLIGVSCGDKKVGQGRGLGRSRGSEGKLCEREISYYFYRFISFHRSSTRFARQSSRTLCGNGARIGVQHSDLF